MFGLEEMVYHSFKRWQHSRELRYRIKDMSTYNAILCCYFVSNWSALFDICP